MDEVAEAVEVIEEITSRDLRILVAAGTIGGLVVGAVVGHLVTKKRMTAKYEQILSQEIAEAKAFYSHLHKATYPTPEDAADALLPAGVKEAAEALLQYQGEAPAEEESDAPDVEVEVNVNVFEQAETHDVWDQEQEEKNRSPEAPYVIHHDEYMENGNGYEQTTLTYYEGDDTLADEKDEPIITVHDVVGDAFQLFGHGSGDAKTVFVRNEKLNMDFEIVKSDGKFAHEVLGLQHSYDGDDGRRRVRRQRGEDD